MMDGEMVIYLGAFVGVVARILIPWLMVWLDEGSKWDWRKAAGQMLSSAGVFLVLVAVNPDLPTLSWQQALALGLSSAAGGWGVADVGRTAQKRVEKKK